MPRLRTSKVRGVTQPRAGEWLVRWVDARGVECKARYIVGRDAADEDEAKELAEARKHEEEGLREEGRTVARQRPKVVTVRSISEQWLARDKAPASVARDRSVLEAHVLPRYGRWAARDITPEECRDLVKEWIAAGLADRTVHTYAGTVAAMWRWAEKAELVDRSPWRGVDLPSPSRIKDKRVRVDLDADGLARLTDALGDQWYPVVLLGLVGLRGQEMCGLKRGALVLIEGRATLTMNHTLSEVRGHLIEGDGKTDAAERTIALPEAVRAPLADWLARHGRLDDPDGYVLRGPRGGPLRWPHFRARYWQPACVAAGLGTIDPDRKPRYQGLVPHALRHHAIALMREAGVPMDVASQRLGHADIRTTLRHYGKLPDPVNRAAAASLDALLEAQSGARIGEISANGPS